MSLFLSATKRFQYNFIFLDAIASLAIWCQSVSQSVTNYKIIADNEDNEDNEDKEDQKGV